MSNEKSLENLKKGEKTRFCGEFAVKNQKKAAESRKRNNSIRALGKMMLSTPMQLDEKALKSIQKSGFDTDAPELQMVILARLGALATSKDAKVAMQAINMLMEITGNDVRSINAAEQRKIERERLALEREKIARFKDADTETERVQIVISPTGGIEVRNGESDG